MFRTLGQTCERDVVDRTLTADHSRDAMMPIYRRMEYWLSFRSGVGLADMTVVKYLDEVTHGANL